MNIYIVYWIHRSCHTNILEEGYVGVTYNIEKRIKSHIYDKTNMHLINAINKYDDIIVDIILINWCEKYCYFIESLLRHEGHIGWNIAMGGKKPPSNKGKHHSLEVRQKISNIKKGKNRTNETKQKISYANSKEWLIISPQGDMYSIINLYKFSKECKLERRDMCRYKNGSRGWKATEIIT